MLIKDATNHLTPPTPHPTHHESKLSNTEFEVNVYVNIILFFPLHLTQ